MTLAAINWTAIIVALIAGTPGILGAIFAYLNRRSLRTPSGDAIGHVAERTHDLAAVNSAAIANVAKTLNGGH